MTTQPAVEAAAAAAGRKRPAQKQKASRLQQQQPSKRARVAAAGDAGEKKAASRPGRQQKQPQQQKSPEKQQQPQQQAKQKKQKRASKGKRQQPQLAAPAKQGGHCVLLSHLPSGLREPQLRRFVGQFGRVLRVRVPRSARSGATKGVAFVELADRAAARVVADTLDNYLLFTRLLRCKVVTDPKRLTFAADGRRRPLVRPAVAATAAVAADAAADDNARRQRQQRERASRLQAKVERLKRLDPGYQFVSPPGSGQ